MSKKRNLNTSSYLDRYYTNKCVILKHCETLRNILHSDESSHNKPVYLFDFSSGDGHLGVTAKKVFGCSFRYFAVDICPHAQDGVKIETCDWLVDGRKHYLQFMKEAKEANAITVVGYNPPFGRAGNTAKKFIEQSNIKGVRPDYFMLIVPIMNWYPENYGPIVTHMLERDSFYLPEGGHPFNASSEFQILKYNAPQPDLHSLNFRAMDTGCLDENKCVWLLVRKVGHYAGRQMYYLGGENIMYWPGNCNENRLPCEYDSSEKTPWRKNNHIVCNTDPPSRYSGSNPQNKKKKTENAKNIRQGTGFLKVMSINGRIPIFTYSEFKMFAKEIESFIESNNLNTGSPKSISVSILERVLYIHQEKIK